MSRSLQRLTTLSALVATLATSGCADTPVVGPYVSKAAQAAAPVLAMLEPVVGPIKGMLGMGVEEAAPIVSPTPRTRPGRAPRDAAAPTAGASASVPTGRSETPVQSDRVVQRNKEFDRLRTTGLMQLYGGETRMAIATFEEAAKLRPDDTHIRELIELAKAPPPPSESRSYGGAPPASRMFEGLAPPPSFGGEMPPPETYMRGGS